MFGCNEGSHLQNTHSSVWHIQNKTTGLTAQSPVKRIKQHIHVDNHMQWVWATWGVHRFRGHTFSLVLRPIWGQETEKHTLLINIHFFLHFLVRCGKEKNTEHQSSTGLVVYAHWHKHTLTHLPGYYSLTVSRETADLSLWLGWIDSRAENRCEGAAERWRDGGESWYQSAADNFMSFFTAWTALSHSRHCGSSSVQAYISASVQYMVDSGV